MSHRISSAVACLKVEGCFFFFNNLPLARDSRGHAQIVAQILFRYGQQEVSVHLELLRTRVKRLGEVSFPFRSTTFAHPWRASPTWKRSQKLLNPTCCSQVWTSRVFQLATPGGIRRGTSSPIILSARLARADAVPLLEYMTILFRLCTAPIS